MRFRTLPRSAIDLSEICFGTMRFAPPDAPEEVAEAGRRALSAAIEAGVNVLHSSEQYGTFDALSAFLASHPKRGELHHIVKVHAPEYEEDRFDAAGLREEIERLLRTLHTDRLAVVQHLQRGPATAAEAYNETGDARRIPLLPQVTEPLMELADELKREGKIGELACFPHTMPFAEAALRDADFDGMVHFFGPLETEMAPLFDELERRRMSFIPIRPLLQGMLTDRRADREVLPSNDRMRSGGWDRWYELRDRLRPVLGGEPSSWTGFSLRFALAPSVVTTIVLSMNTEQQVADALAAADGDYPDEELVRAVDRAIADLGRIPKETLM